MTIYKLRLLLILFRHICTNIMFKKRKIILQILLGYTGVRDVLISMLDWYWYQHIFNVYHSSYQNRKIILMGGRLGVQHYEYRSTIPIDMSTRASTDLNVKRYGYYSLVLIWCIWLWLSGQVTKLPQYFQTKWIQYHAFQCIWYVCNKRAQCFDFILLIFFNRKAILIKVVHFTYKSLKNGSVAPAYIWLFLVKLITKLNFQSIKLIQNPHFLK